MNDKSNETQNKSDIKQILNDLIVAKSDRNEIQDLYKVISGDHTKIHERELQLNIGYLALIAVFVSINISLLEKKFYIGDFNFLFILILLFVTLTSWILGLNYLNWRKLSKLNILKKIENEVLSLKYHHVDEDLVRLSRNKSKLANSLSKVLNIVVKTPILSGQRIVPYGLLFINFILGIIWFVCQLTSYC